MDLGGEKQGLGADPRYIFFWVGAVGVVGGVGPGARTLGFSVHLGGGGVGGVRAGKPGSPDVWVLPSSSSGVGGEQKLGTKMPGVSPAGEVGSGGLGAGTPPGFFLFSGGGVASGLSKQLMLRACAQTPGIFPALGEE